MPASASTSRTRAWGRCAPKLGGAGLSDADITGADFYEADLSGAIFRGVKGFAQAKGFDRAETFDKIVR